MLDGEYANSALVLMLEAQISSYASETSGSIAVSSLDELKVMKQDFSVFQKDVMVRVVSLEDWKTKEYLRCSFDVLLKKSVSVRSDQNSAL